MGDCQFTKEGRGLVRGVGGGRYLPLFSDVSVEHLLDAGHWTFLFRTEAKFPYQLTDRLEGANWILGAGGAGGMDHELCTDCLQRGFLYPCPLFLRRILGQGYHPHYSGEELRLRDSYRFLLNFTARE